MRRYPLAFALVALPWAALAQPAPATMNPLVDDVLGQWAAMQNQIGNVAKAVAPVLQQNKALLEEARELRARCGAACQGVADAAQPAPATQNAAQPAPAVPHPSGSPPAATAPHAPAPTGDAGRTVPAGVIPQPGQATPSANDRAGPSPASRAGQPGSTPASTPGAQRPNPPANPQPNPAAGDDRGTNPR